jgi:DNA replication protein DnaC
MTPRSPAISSTATSPETDPTSYGVTDITEHPTREGTVYCAVVLDVHARRVVGWSIDASDRGAGTNALSMAIANRQPNPGETIIHSDHGTQTGLNRSLQHRFVVAGKENVVFLGPPGTGKTHLAIGLAIRACQAGHRVLFATAAEWVGRLADAHHAGRLQAELTKLGRCPLLVVDEVGYIPFEAEAANLFFQLVSSRYERAGLIVTSSKVFGRWGEVFGDDVVAAAMIDRLVHHAEVIALKGDSYRLKDRDLGRVPAAGTTEE